MVDSVVKDNEITRFHFHVLVATTEDEGAPKGRLTATLEQPENCAAKAYRLIAIAHPRVAMRLDVAKLQQDGTVSSSFPAFHVWEAAHEFFAAVGAEALVGVLASVLDLRTSGQKMTRNENHACPLLSTFDMEIW